MLRKAGLIINEMNPTTEIKQRWQKEAKEKYGLTPEQLRDVNDQLNDFFARSRGVTTTEGVTIRSVCKESGDGPPLCFRGSIERVPPCVLCRMPVFGLMGADPAVLTRTQLLTLLERLAQRRRQGTPPKPTRTEKGDPGSHRLAFPHHRTHAGCCRTD